MTTAPTPLHQECTDFATSLRSAFNVVITTRGSARKSLLRAAVLLESAAAALRRLQAENERLRAELEARKPLTDGEIIAAKERLRAQQEELYRSRIGLQCANCQTGKYRADGNGYHNFHRCDSCMHVPMWGADGNELGPAPLIARREVVSDGPVRVTRLHLSTEGRAALTTTATGPLPGITGGSS